MTDRCASISYPPGPGAALLGRYAGNRGRTPRRAAADPAGIVAALWPLVCQAITLELVALVASPTNQHPIVTDAPPAEWTADLPVDAQPAPGHAPAVTALGDRAPEAGEAGHDTGTDTGTGTGTGTDNRNPGGRDARSARSRKQARASRYAGGHERTPARAGAHSAHSSPAGYLRLDRADARTRERASTRHGTLARRGPKRAPRPGPDRARTRRRHPRLAAPAGGHNRAGAGRRKVIKMWALGSPRADRLRGIVIDEAASKGAHFGGGTIPGDAEVGDHRHQHPGEYREEYQQRDHGRTRVAEDRGAAQDKGLQ
jgi:hypothetical protein